MAEPLHIEFTRFSAFYSPLIATIAGGYLQDEGFAPTHAVCPPGRSAIEGVLSGAMQVGQSAPSQAFAELEKGRRPAVAHFAQINEMDGFFLVARQPDGAFRWPKLKGRRVIIDHGAQPLAMFKYACMKRGLRFEDITALNIPSRDMEAAFRGGEGDYIHLQGPHPQQLEHDKLGHIVASCGAAIGPCAFSSLVATRDWLLTPQASRFMRAYRKARAWVIATPAAEVAKVEAPFFPGIEPAVLARTISAYQKLGNWTPHVEVTRPAWEAVNDIFLNAKLITRRHRYEDAIAPPPPA
jgi:NitT/TauT family transport system substrate-binding protein